MRNLVQKGALVGTLTILLLASVNAMAGGMICECHQWSDGSWVCKCYRV